MDYFYALLGGFNIEDPNLLFSGLAIVCLLLYGLSLGRTRALVSLLSIYVAFVFEMTFPYFEQLQNIGSAYIDEVAISKALVFLVVYGIVFAIMNRSLMKQRFSLDEASIMSVSVVSLLQLGFLVSILANIAQDSLPARTTEVIQSGGFIKVPETVAPYFSSSEALFYWSVLPIVVLLFIKGKRHRRSLVG